MTQLGRLIAEAIILEYGRDELLRRLAHPFWFQAFGCVMGMDWHSSGITTSVLGALKRGLNPVAHELGVYVCGGRGRHSRATPAELLDVGARTGLDGAALGRVSRLVAKVDNTAIQDGFQLYLHGFIATADGKWVVVQQGMREDSHTARRYHWLSEKVASFVEEPHAAIDGEMVGSILNLTDTRARESRDMLAPLARSGPDSLWRTLGRSASAPVQPHLIMPDHHEVRPENVNDRRLYATLSAAADRAPEDFQELLLTPGVGPRTVSALALVAEVVHGAPSRFTDPARYSLAHGGKDGHPYPVPLVVYDKTIGVLRDALGRARLGNDDKLHAFRVLDRSARAIEATATRGEVDSLDVVQIMREERAASPMYGGMTVFGPADGSSEPPRATFKAARKPRVHKEKSGQLGLFARRR